MNKERNYDMSKDMLIVITGAGGFIGGNLAKYFSDQGLTRIRAVDKKPICEWTCARLVSKTFASIAVGKRIAIGFVNTLRRSDAA
jgi:nucleoside-diphosphate-sugar epimerase